MAQLDARAAGVLPGGEDRQHPVLVDERLAVGHRRHHRAAAEEHPVERGVGSVAVGGGVPRDDLRLGPRQGDVEQSERLARVLAPVAADRLAVEGARPADVAAAAALVVVEERDGRIASGEAVPQGREVDDGVLQALAAVDGDQLDGRGVGVEAAGALGGDLELLVGDLLAQPGEQSDQAHPLLGADPQQGLADVAQVGEGALAADAAQHPGGESLDGRHLHHCRDAAPGEDVGQDADPGGRSSVRSSPPASSDRGGVAEEGREGSRLAPGRRGAAAPSPRGG